MRLGDSIEVRLLFFNRIRARARARAPSVRAPSLSEIREKYQIDSPIDLRTVSGIYLQRSICLNYAVNNTGNVLTAVNNFLTISRFHSVVVESVGNPVGCTYTIKSVQHPPYTKNAWCTKWN